MKIPSSLILHWQRIIGLIVTLLLGITSAQSQSVDSTFTHDSLIYRIISENNVSVVGPIQDTTPTDIVIPEHVSYNNREFTITEIGSYAFYNCNSLNSIKISSSVTMIDSLAFAFCRALTSIEFPKQLKEINYRAFAACSELIAINLPDSITTIGDEVFYPCGNLTAISFPASLRSIGASAIRSPLKAVCFRGIRPPMITNGEHLYLYSPEDMSIYVPAESVSLYQALIKTNMQSANIRPLRPLVNYAKSVTITPTSLLLPSGVETTQSFRAIVKTNSGDEYDGDYNWSLKNGYGTILTNEDDPSHIDINLMPILNSDVVVAVFSSDSTFTTATCKITPLRIQLPASLIMQPEDNYVIEAKIMPDEYADDYTIKLSSSSPAIADINEISGEINVKTVGETNIFAEAYDRMGNLVTKNKTTLYSFDEIKPIYDSIAISNKGQISILAMVELTGLNMGWNATSVISKDKSVFSCATASNSTIIFAHNIGNSILEYNFSTATGHHYKFHCPLEVVNEITDFNIIPENGSGIIVSGETLCLKAKIEDGFQLPAFWFSTNESVANIDPFTGRVTAYNAGFCNIECSYMLQGSPELTKSFEVIVLDKNNPNTIALNITNLDLIIGTTERLIATTIPFYIEDRVIWTSSDKSVATVDAAGEVIAVGEGHCEIIATVDGTNISAKCAVEVNKSSGIIDTNNNPVHITTTDNQIIVTGIPNNQLVKIYNTTGSCISSTQGNSTVNITTGIYIVKIGSETFKVAVK